MNLLHPAQFQMDATPDKTFAGFTNGETWNGWACPRFTKEVALEVMKALATDGYAWYDEQKDAFIFLNEEYTADEVAAIRKAFPQYTAAMMEDVEFEVFDGFDLEGKHLYAIGAWGWTWDTVEPESEEMP